MVSFGRGEILSKIGNIYIRHSFIQETSIKHLNVVKTGKMKIAEMIGMGSHKLVT